MELGSPDISYFAQTDFRNQKRQFGIKQEDRTRHLYVIGKTGMGKSTLLRNLAIQDINNGRGMAFMDPHGNLVEELLDYVPEDRVDDILYFAPFDLSHPISFNVMEDVGHERRHLVANGLMSAFKKIWVDMWSARMEYILNNTLLALLEYPDSTLLGVNRMLADKTYRKRVVANISDVAVRSFWEDEFASYSDRYMTEAGAAIQNKIGQFISNPLIRNIIGQSHSSFDPRELMDNKKILLINLSKGKVGEDNANLLGSMLITKIYLGAMSRSDVSPYELKNLPQFYFYVDEFQSFANESFADILSEARKYNLSLTIAHQYIEQMSDEVRAAVFGNVGTMITFRVGATDAEALEKEFAPVFSAEDIVNLGFAQVYLRLMIDGVGSKPFSANTLPPVPLPEQSFADLVVSRSRQNYALRRAEVEEQLAAWHESNAGLIDDPHVARRRDKENKSKERHVEAYRESRQNLDDANNKIKIPQPNRSKGSIKPESGSSPDLNQRLQKAIAKTQVYHEDKSTKKANLSESKKTGSKDSLADLRSTLSDVLKDAGIKVPDKSKKNNQKKTSKKFDSPKSKTNKPSEKSAKENNKNQKDSVDKEINNSRADKPSKSSDDFEQPKKTSRSTSEKSDNHQNAAQGMNKRDEVKAAASKDIQNNSDKSKNPKKKTNPDSKEGLTKESRIADDKTKSSSTPSDNKKEKIAQLSSSKGDNQPDAQANDSTNSQASKNNFSKSKQTAAFELSEDELRSILEV
jgi:hypothetical protein